MNLPSKLPDMPDFDAAKAARIVIPLGQTRTVQCIPIEKQPAAAQAAPFIETPAHVSLARQVAHEDGTGKVLTFTLKGERTGIGVIRLGFRNSGTQEVLIEKSLRVTVR